MSFIELNFGKNAYYDYHPYESGDDMVVRVPEFGQLKPLPRYFQGQHKLKKGDLPCMGLQPPRQKSDRFLAIKIPLLADWDNFEIEKSIIIPWINKRQPQGEWVVIYYDQIQQNSLRKDDNFDGPYALDAEGILQNYILSAFGIPRAYSKLRPQDWSRTSPAELRKIGLREQGVIFSLSFGVPKIDETYAVDWDKEKWTYSEREYGDGHRWIMGQPITDKEALGRRAYEELYSQFGIEKTELPPEQLLGYSPRRLYLLGSHDPRSATLGDFRTASEFFEPAQVQSNLIG